MHQTIRTLVRPLALSLAAALAFVAFAQVDVRFGIFDGERLVGKGELEIDVDERKLEIELLAGYEGVVSLTLPTADGGTVEYVGTVGPDGLKLLGFPDLAAFAAVLGDGVTVLVTYDDSIHPDELVGDDDAGREDDDMGGDDDAGREDDDMSGDDDAGREDDDMSGDDDAGRDDDDMSGDDDAGRDDDDMSGDDDAGRDDDDMSGEDDSGRGDDDASGDDDAGRGDDDAGGDDDASGDDDGDDGDDDDHDDDDHDDHDDDHDDHDDA